MKLSLLIQRTCIVTDVKGEGKSKKEILSGLFDVLIQNTSLKDEEVPSDEILAKLVLREEELSTAVGEGFAFPHARLTGLKGFYMLLGISPEGVHFDAPDHKPVHFFIMSLVPMSNPNLLLQTRAALTKFLLSKQTRTELMAGAPPDQVWEMIDSSKISINKDIVAKDIMLPQVGCVYSAMTLKEAAIALHKYHSDSLPMLDDNNNFIGDISCHDLFSYGLPNFFSTLKTISFVRNMNPFEKYFLVDNTLRIGDLNIDRESPIIPPDATLMEIIFEMTTHNRQILYVVENEKLLGVIDRFSIVDKILVNS